MFIGHPSDFDDLFGTPGDVPTRCMHCSVVGLLLALVFCIDALAGTEVGRAIAPAYILMSGLYVVLPYVKAALDLTMHVWQGLLPMNDANWRETPQACGCGAADLSAPVWQRWFARVTIVLQFLGWVTILATMEARSPYSMVVIPVALLVMIVSMGFYHASTRLICRH